MKKLYSARFLATVSLTFTFCYMGVVGTVSSDVFVPVLIIVLNYYFKEVKRENTPTNPIP